MRLAPVPICYHNDISKAMLVASQQSKISHQGDEAAECCRLLTYIIVKGIQGELLKDVLNHLGDHFQTPNKSVQALANSQMENNDRDRDWNLKSKNFKYSETRSQNMPGYIGSYVMDATSMALHCAFSTKSAKEAIIKAVNICGDADSVASVTGQIVGSFYGIHKFPSNWIKAVCKWDDGDLLIRAYRLFSQNWIE